MVPRLRIEKAESLAAVGSNHMVNLRKVEQIFRIGLVEAGVVDTDSPFPILDHDLIGQPNGVLDLLDECDG